MFNTDGNQFQNNIIIREVQSGDVDKLISLYGTFSRESIYYRYLRHCEAPLDECYEICNLQAGQNGAAVVAIETETGRIVGVAHYIHTDRKIAEPAIIVADDCQIHGIGTKLFGQLCAMGSVNGVSLFHADVHPSNRVMLRIIKKSGYEFKAYYMDGQMHCRIQLH